MNYFVTGTDTDIGKTVLSLALMKSLLENKSEDGPFYFKPFQTGCKSDPLGDAGFIYQNIPSLQGKDPKSSMLYHFNEPLAPLFAAQREGQQIELDIFDKKIAELSALYKTLVIEGSGGLMVPITKDKTILDFMKRVPHLKTILAARTGLGTINHTLLSISKLQQENFDIMGVVMIHSSNSSNRQNEKDIQENIEAIESFSSCKVLGLIPHLMNFEKELKSDLIRIFH